MQTQLEIGPSTQNVEPWLSSREAATILKIKSKTLEKHAREGLVPAYRRFDRWFFRRSELDQWVSGGVNSAQPITSRN